MTSDGHPQIWLGCRKEGGHFGWQAARRKVGGSCNVEDIVDGFIRKLFHVDGDSFLIAVKEYGRNSYQFGYEAQIKNSVGVIIMFSVTSEDSFAEAK